MEYAKLGVVDGPCKGVFLGAGFDALDSGRDVRKLTGRGIRLNDAAFDPARRRSQNISASIFALPAPALVTGLQERE